MPGEVIVLLLVAAFVAWIAYEVKRAPYAKDGDE